MILSSLRNYEVGILLCRLYKLFVHGLKHFEITADNHVYGAPAFEHVALYVAYQTLIRVGVNKYLQVHHVAQFLVEQSHDAFNDYHRFRLNVQRLFQSVTLDIRICGLLNGLSVSQFVSCLISSFQSKASGWSKFMA